MIPVTILSFRIVGLVVINTTGVVAMLRVIPGFVALALLWLTLSGGVCTSFASDFPIF